MKSMEWASYPLFSYEKELGRREVASLVGANANVTQPVSLQRLHQRATFLESVQLPGGMSETLQAQVERAHRRIRSRKAKRQSTRFLVHGIHEYKGKFNPQLARALVNVVDPTSTALIDPFCGSGTTLVEGMRLGMKVGGVDRNPFAAWLTQIKTQALARAGDNTLADVFRFGAERVASAMAEAQRQGDADKPAWVSAEDEKYLRSWFPHDVLAALWNGLGESAEVSDEVCRELLRVCISSLVRSVSWQLPEDLRVRRRPAGWVPPSVAPLFKKAADKVELSLIELAEAQDVAATVQATVMEGSSREACTLAQVAPEGRRLVVTSPPYATALPYIDTDRLSLVLLGLSPASDIRRLERGLTGSREWTTKTARQWDHARDKNSSHLPDAVLQLAEQIELVNEREGAGFRRAALPSLLYRYFAEMGETLTATGSILDTGERAVFVVGANKTGRGSSAIAIETPELIGAVAELRGFILDEIIPLETWPRYGMHAGNAVSTESAVVLTRAAK